MILIMESNKNWVRIYSAEHPYKTIIVKGILKEYGIYAIILNKRDSVYNTFGEAELYILRKDQIKAMDILISRCL